MDPYLVGIIVRDTANFTSAQLAEAAAAGVLRMLSSRETPEHVYTTWVASGMRKLTKRLKPKDFARYVASAPLGALVGYGELQVFVTTPYLRSEESPLLKRAQVAGFTTLPTSVFEVDHSTSNFLTISLNSALAMSAGKAAAAAGHIAQLAGEKLSASDSLLYRSLWQTWKKNDFQMIVTQEEFTSEKIEQALVFVADAGHTEVEPGSITALGRWTS